MSRIRTLILVPALAACASGGQGASPDPSPAATPGAAPTPWAIKTREHVDLWLHSYAMLSTDTALVPMFRRGYRDQMQVAKNRANIVSSLDANREKLSARLNSSPNLINGQFVPLYFGTWDEMKRYIQIFLQVEGNPQGAPSQDAAQAVALLAGSYSSAADREWLRLFVQSVDNESERFYHSYWVAQQSERGGVIAALDGLWRTHRPKLQRFLNNTQQSDGEFLLSMPLGGEGRTVVLSQRQNVVAVAFPERSADAAEALYVFAHEVVGNIAAQAVADNTTPAEKREGIAGRYQSNGAVMGGYMLLSKVAPELADGYAQFYVRQAGGSVGGRQPLAALSATFPLPEHMRSSIERQITIVLSGI